MSDDNRDELTEDERDNLADTVRRITGLVAEDGSLTANNGPRVVRLCRLLHREIARQERTIAELRAGGNEVHRATVAAIRGALDARKVPTATTKGAPLSTVERFELAIRMAGEAAS